MKRIFLMLIIFLISINSMSIVNSEDWWNSTFNFKKNITVSGLSYFVINLPVRLNLSEICEGKCYSDYRDIRIIDSANVTLPIDFISANGNKTPLEFVVFLMNASANGTWGAVYYNNSNATSIETNFTFLFDTFEQYGTANTTINVSNENYFENRVWNGSNFGNMTVSSYCMQGNNCLYNSNISKSKTSLNYSVSPLGQTNIWFGGIVKTNTTVADVYIQVVEPIIRDRIFYYVLGNPTNGEVGTYDKVLYRTTNSSYSVNDSFGFVIKAFSDNATLYKNGTLIYPLSSGLLSAEVRDAYVGEYNSYFDYLIAMNISFNTYGFVPTLTLGAEENDIGNVSNSCSYSSGNWVINASDHCNLTVTNLLGYNVSITGGTPNECCTTGLRNLSNYSFLRIDNAFVVN